MSLAMTKEEREAFLADVHVGIISVAEDGHGPLTVPVWYSYEPGGEVRIITARASPRESCWSGRADSVRARRWKRHRIST